MSSWLEGQSCPLCGKKFFMQDRKSYLYKIKDKRTRYYCSYTCVNKAKDMLAKEKISSESEGIIK